MISRKYQRIVFAFFMALFMSCVMSLFISILNVGIVPNIISILLKAWSLAFLVAFPTVLTISPIVNKIVSLVLKDEPPKT